MATGIIQSYDETKVSVILSPMRTAEKLPFSGKSVVGIEIPPVTTRVNYDEKRGERGGAAINITQVS